MVGGVIHYSKHPQEHFMPDTPKILTRDDGGAIAYHRIPGKTPGVIFLTGFKSDMTGSKALALEDFCRDRGQAFLRFDYTGHGGSSGAFEDGTIGQWAMDAVFALDHLTEGPQILVGSSMGGWIMLLAALARPDRIAGLVGTAAAPDFTEDLMRGAFSPEQIEQLKKQGFAEVPNCYEDEEPYKITQALLDDGRNQSLLGAEIALDCPVRLIHGDRDEDVPWQTSLRIAETIRSNDVETQIIKGGDHRLSEPRDLDRLCGTLGRLLDQL
jgi:pimeloyl-ACP methyl ester carboxylesterase